MRNYVLVGFVLSGFVLAGLASASGSALAAPRKAKAKPMKIPATIVVENRRSVELLNLSIAPSDAEDKVLATLKKPLGAGKKTVVSLKGLKSCSVMVAGTFADDGDASGEIDVCREKSITLVE